MGLPLTQATYRQTAGSWAISTGPAVADQVQLRLNRQAMPRTQGESKSRQDCALRQVEQAAGQRQASAVQSTAALTGETGRRYDDWQGGGAAHAPAVQRARHAALTLPCWRAAKADGMATGRAVLDLDGTCSRAWRSSQQVVAESAGGLRKGFEGLASYDKDPQLARLEGRQLFHAAMPRRCSSKQALG